MSISVRSRRWIGITGIIAALVIVGATAVLAGNAATPRVATGDVEASAPTTAVGPSAGACSDRCKLNVFEDPYNQNYVETGTGFGHRATWQVALYPNAELTGSPIGYSQGTCTYVDVGTGMCSWTAIVNGKGSVSADGLLGPQGCGLCDGSMAVVGGTGDFSKARGTVAVDCQFTTPNACKYALKYSR